ncbi:hypothetical protein ACU42Y_03675 [Proteus mirabilis]
MDGFISKEWAHLSSITVKFYCQNKR